MTNQSNRADDNGVDALDDLEMFQIDEQDQALSQIEEELAEASQALDDPYQGQGLPPARRIEAQPSERRRSRPQRRTKTRAQAPVMGYVLIALGLALAGLAMADLPQLRTGFAKLAPTGISPALLLFAGVILLAVHALRRRQTNIQNSVDEVTATIQGSESDVMANLEYLVTAQEQHLERRPASGEELEQVLLVLQRQDDKVNNLTKALKMYGKPLIEITKMLSEMTGRQEAIAGSIQANRDQISNVEEATLLAGEAVQKLPQQIQEIQAGMTQGSDEDVYNILKQVQREVGGIATSVSQLRTGGGSVVRGGGSSPTPPPAPASSGSTDATPAATAASEALAQSISGTKKSSGKGVLGSIQKLRKMRK